MGKLAGSTDQIAASGQFAAGKASELESGISSFSAEVEVFLSGGWQGQASEAFEPPFQDWVANAKKVQQALASMAELLGQSATEYQGAEEGNEASIQTVQVKSPEFNF